MPTSKLQNSMKLETKQNKIKKCSVKHEVLWVPDDSDHSRCAAVLYLVTKTKSHVHIVLPNPNVLALMKNVLRWAGVSCSSATDNPVLAQFRDGSVSVLLTCDDLNLQHGAFGPLSVVILFRASGSLFLRRVSSTRRFVTGAEMLCVTLASKCESNHLHVMMKSQPTNTTFNQRTIEDDVLADLKKQIVDNDITADTIIAEPTTASSIDTKVSIKTLDKKLKKNAKKAFRKANDDLFYSELSNNSLYRSLASDKKKRKRTQHKSKKREERSQQDEDEYSDVASADDDYSDDEDVPHRKSNKNSSKSTPKQSYTEALTDITEAGVKKSRSALTYEEKKAYSERLLNEKK